ncbi:MAG: hypothetical protein K8R25_07980 [Methanosarcinales archaeon]|nr:hypothetical protein [Methanosarcinales archaeon]
MKYTYIVLLLLFISLFLINPVNADSKVAPYADIPIQLSANWPKNYMDAEFIQVNNNDRIRQNGDISKIKFAVADASNLMEFYFTIWRKNEIGGYDRIAITDNLRGDISNGINEIELSEPISGVQEGDYYGYRIKTSGPALYVDTREIRLTYYVDGSVLSIINFDWESNRDDWDLYIFVIEPYMDNPYMTFIGDSIIVGIPQHLSFLHENENTNIPSTIEYQWSDKVNDRIYQNMGYGGHGTPELQNRFNEDVVQLDPEFALIEGGIIDIRRVGGTNEVIINNWRAMIEEAYNNGITPVIMLILPCTDIDDSKSERVDVINEQLITMAAEYSPSIVVDARSYVGIDRSSGVDGNLWDIIPSYTSDDLHFNSAGNERIAQAIKDSFKYVYGKPGLCNLIQSDGTIIYSGGLSNAINTSWRMASISGIANVIYNEPSSHEIARFTINSGTVDWFSICDLSSGQDYYLRNSDGSFIESSTAINEMVKFTTDISHGTYYVNYIIPDILDPVILTATADPDEIEANGIDNTLLNVTAFDIDSGIASVTINLLALNGSPVQPMTNNSGVWQCIINATIIGDHILPVNVTDNAGNSNTSVYILLNASDTILPVITSPDDRQVEQNLSGNITWNITEIHPDKYWILRNGTQIIPPSSYENGDNIIVPINTSTLGTWDYIIFATDESWNTASDQVNISIISNWRDEWMGENSPGGTTVTTSELQDAIHHWLENLPVKDHTLSTPDLQEVIAVWLSE